MSKKYIYIVMLSVAVIVATILVVNLKKTAERLVTHVRHGSFEQVVVCSGELAAKQAINIMGPSGLRNARIYQIKLEKIIPEGSFVKKGDFIAQLDQSELHTKIRDVELELQKITAQLDQEQLDTTMKLRQEREELYNLELHVQDQQLEVEQSIYEPPITQKKAQIALEKSKRSWATRKEQYQLKLSQAKAKLRETELKLIKRKQQLSDLYRLLSEFTIVAPQDGMLIYKRDWKGRRQTAGTSINAWDPIIATLPDLSEMVSKTFVNEVDIGKIKLNQSVKIILDAFPDNNFNGVVTHISNVGEYRPEMEAKVFQVDIDIEQSDSLLRPAMTTSNTILIHSFGQVNYIPLECVFNQGDSLVYVLAEHHGDWVRQEVKLGMANSNFVIVEMGLAEQQSVMLNLPENLAPYPLKLLSN